MKTSKTTIDWLRFRSKGEPKQVLEAIRPMYGEGLADYVQMSFCKGILGFQQGANLQIANVPLGRMDWGGDHMRGWVRVDLTGKGCSLVNDWDAIDGLEALPASELRRLDVALTTWKGEVNHDMVVQAHANGGFTTSGRPPVLSQITSSDERAGRTCYIGSREGDKFARCYEKGYEMAAKGGVWNITTPEQFVQIEGSTLDQIYRCEIELKPVNTVVPWEVVERSDQYFTGSYPFFAEILPGIEADILQRRPEREAQRSLQAALANVRKQYGSALYTALHAYGGDIGAVWEKVCGDHHNQALLEAGVLLFDDIGARETV